MGHLGTWKGFTLQVYAEDMDRALSWYQKLFGRNPDYTAGPEFLEWEVFSEFWFQVVKKEGQIDSQRKRFGVSDIDRERRRIIEEMGIEVSEVEELPKGVVKWCNFQDPWGNKLGLFQDLEKYPSKKG
jgi:predicted enzyme related to lactoylglutathione lyase